MSIPPFAEALAAHGYDADTVLRDLAALVTRRVRRLSLTPHFAVTIRPEGLSVRPRADVVGELKAAGLDDGARILASAKPKPGEIMCWLESELDVQMFLLSVPQPTKGTKR